MSVTMARATPLQPLPCFGKPGCWFGSGVTKTELLVPDSMPRADSGNRPSPARKPSNTRVRVLCAEGAPADERRRSPRVGGGLDDSPVESDGSGSGSVTAILPIVSAVATAPPDRVAATLIIDPKHEIAPVLQRLAPERLRHLTTGEVALDLMAGPRWQLDEDLASGR